MTFDPAQEKWCAWSKHAKADTDAGDADENRPLLLHPKWGIVSCFAHCCLLLACQAKPYLAALSPFLLAKLNP